MIAVLLGLLLAVTGLLYLLDVRARRVCMELPGPESLPFIGSAHVIVSGSVDFFQSAISTYHEFGSRVKMFLGPTLWLLLADPKDVEVVMTNSEFINKAKEYDFLHPWLGRGLLTAESERWRKHRKIITPAFHFKILENFIDVFDKQTDILIKTLKKYSDKGSFNVYPIMTMYAMDIISETAMGVSIKAQEQNDSEYVRAVKDMCEVMYERAKNIFKRSDILFKLSSDYKKQTNALKILHSFTNKMIQERKQHLQENRETLESYMQSEDDVYGRKKKMAFLDLLLLSTINGEHMADTDIREEVDTFLFEGHDTTTSALSFALYEISQHPEVQKKLFEEQQSIFGDNLNRPATHSDLQDMKYLEMALKESLRLFPSVPILGRITSCDTKINDIYVPKSTSVIIMVYNMNRNPDIFPNPDSFIPERFLPEESSKRHPFSNISFSAGQRNCIGQRFAMAELKSAVSKIIRNFELLPSVENIELICDCILKSRTGIYIRLKERIYK